MMHANSTYDTMNMNGIGTMTEHVQEWRQEIKREEEKQRLLLVKHRRQDYKKHMNDLRQAQLQTLRKKRRDVQLINEQNHDKQCEKRQQELYELNVSVEKWNFCYSDSDTDEYC